MALDQEAEMTADEGEGATRGIKSHAEAALDLLVRTGKCMVLMSMGMVGAPGEVINHLLIKSLFPSFSLFMITYLASRSLEKILSSKFPSRQISVREIEECIARSVSIVHLSRVFGRNRLKRHAMNLLILLTVKTYSPKGNCVTKFLGLLLCTEELMERKK